MGKAFDVLGNVAIVNFRKDVKQKEKKKFAEKILKDNKAIKTVLEKVGKVSGRLRKPTTKYLAGEKTKEVLYKENNCVFRFDVDETYFSPRLSNERKEIASMIKKGEKVLVMFAGVNPFGIVIAKNSKVGQVATMEINRKAREYSELNRQLNNVKDIVNYPMGNVKSNLDWECFYPTKFKIENGEKVPVKGKWIKTKYDVIVMPRPQLKETFLKEAFFLSKKGTRIFYYDFCKEDDKKLIVEKIQNEARKYRRKIKILKVKKAGEIAPYKIRVRVDFKII